MEVSTAGRRSVSDQDRIVFWVDTVYLYLVISVLQGSIIASNVG